MFKNYRKLSIITFLNVIIILVLQYSHESTIGLSHTMMFRILFVYAIINGAYIQKILFNQKKIQKKLERERIFSSKILETISSSVIIVNSSMQITYLNKSGKELFGSEISSNSHLSKVFDESEKVIHLVDNALSGQQSSKKTIENRDKSLLVEVLPFEIESSDLHVMIHIDDISENVTLNNLLEKQYLNMFKSFVKFIDAKDTYTGLHSASVSDYVSKILEGIDLNKDEKKEILTAANLHDIGKIGVPEIILNKPGKLTHEEYNKMKEHPSIGESLISEINGYEQIAKIIRHHHEKYNGLGYPDGLKGEEIPLGSRVIAVADAFDAITSDRVYKSKRSYDQARRILIEESGRQFDQEIVNIFLESIRELCSTPV